MKIYRDYVLPRLINCALNAGWLNKLRGKALARGAQGLAGLEVGFGSGLSLPHLPVGVTSLVALEPSKTAFQLAASRVRTAPFPVEHLCTTCEDATLPAGDFDFAATTCTLCTVGDPRAALCKVREALKPGGRFYFLEHGRSPNQLSEAAPPGLLDTRFKLVYSAVALQTRPIDKLLEENRRFQNRLSGSIQSGRDGAVLFHVSRSRRAGIVKAARFTIRFLS